jgi:hypothetical protein
MPEHDDGQYRDSDRNDRSRREQSAVASLHDLEAIYVHCAPIAEPLIVAELLAPVAGRPTHRKRSPV